MNCITKFNSEESFPQLINKVRGSMFNFAFHYRFLTKIEHDRTRDFECLK